MGISFSFQGSHLPMLMSSLMSWWPRITPVIQPCLASRKGLFLVEAVLLKIILVVAFYIGILVLKKSWTLSFVSCMAFSGLFEQMGSWSVWNSGTEKKCTWGWFWGRRGRQGGTAYGNWWTKRSWKCEHFRSESVVNLPSLLMACWISFYHLFRITIVEGALQGNGIGTGTVTGNTKGITGMLLMNCTALIYRVSCWIILTVFSTA